MCGIVGAIGERNVTDVLIEGLRRLEYRGYDSAGLAVVDQGAVVRERQPGKVQALADAAHAADVHGRLGIAHTRWATHGAPTQCNAHPHMSGDIAPARTPAGRGLRVHLADRHRSGGAPDPVRAEAGRRLLPGRAPRGRAAARRVRAGHRARLRAGPAAGRAPGLAAGGGPGHRRELHQLRPARAAAGHQPFHLPRGRRLHRARPQPRQHLERRRRTGAPAGGGAGRHAAREQQGRLQALHAEGDLRAAGGRAAHAQRPHQRWPGRCRRLRTAGRRAAGEGAAHTDPGLRHQLPRRLCRQVLVRGHRRRVLPCRGGQRVPLPHHGAAGGHADRDHFAVGRDRRHAGGAARGQGARAGRAVHLQRADLDAGARVRSGVHHPCRSRDRRGLDQGLHHPAGGADAAGAGHRPSPGHAVRRARARHRAAAGHAASTAGWRAGAGQGHRAHRRGVRREAPHPVPRPWRAVPGGDGRGAEAQGDLLHPRRGLPGGRAQARPAGAGRQRHAGGGGGAEERPDRQAQVEPAGGARARRRALRVRRPCRRRAPGGGHQGLPHAQRRRRGGTDRLHRAAAAAVVPRGGDQGHRRRPAAQPGEIGDGGVSRAG
ncbi:UNVERIFIED_CONTAM: glmS [Trichonephila clavipes]